MVRHVKSMGASTAGVLSRPNYLAKIFWNVLLLLLTILTWITGFYGFSRVTPFGACGGPEKDRDVCFVVGLLRTLSPDSSCQLDISGHDGDSPCVNGAEIGIVKQPDKICLRCLLETQYRRRLESQVCLVVLGDLPHHPLERQLSDEQRRAPLEVTDVLQSRSSRSVPVGFY